MAGTHTHNIKNLGRIRSLMLHSLGFATGDLSIMISRPFLFHPGLQVTVIEPGDSKWIYLMLPLDRGSLITDIKIAHHRTGFQSHVTLVRLIEQHMPISATIVHDKTIDKTIPSTSVIDLACHVVVDNSLLLKVCMNFANTDDMIEFGSVEVRYIPDYTSFMEKKKKDKKAPKEWGTPVEAYPFSGDFLLNAHRPSLAELFRKKIRKINFLK